MKDQIWNLSRKEKKIYLTFDDGPTKGVTEKVLELLHDYDAQATFFCLGKQIESNPFIFQSIIDQGHAVGNHSYSHLNGWETNDDLYYDDINKCQILFHSTLFRPPYGKISRQQVKILKEQFTIVMWDVLSGDFDHTISAEKCYQNVVKNAENGSIIVFHDSEKAATLCLKTLPRILDFYKNKGFEFCKLNLP
jgi:peptidoglycan-N-acetylglucosamine deacetylase